MITLWCNYILVVQIVFRNKASAGPHFRSGSILKKGNRMHGGRHGSFYEWILETNRYRSNHPYSVVFPIERSDQTGHQSKAAADWRADTA